MRLVVNGVRSAVDQVVGLQFQLYTSAELPPAQSWDLSIASESEGLHFSSQQSFQSPCHASQNDLNLRNLGQTRAIQYLVGLAPPRESFNMASRPGRAQRPYHCLVC